MMLGLKGSRVVALDGNDGLPLVTLDPLLRQISFQHHGHYGHWGPNRPDRTWFDDASLLWIKRIEGRPFEVDLTIEDLVLRREDLEYWTSSRREWLEDEERSSR